MQRCNLLGWIVVRKFFCYAEQLKGCCAEILFVGRVYYMDTRIFTANDLPRIIQQLLPAVGPALLIAIGYVDPGKWAAVVEGGARFGSDLVLLMLVFGFAAILCQYLSASIAVVTGRDLSQICSEEYGKATCIFLGVLTEISMIALDLTMILGTAHGLNLIFGVDLFTCVFLTAIDAVLFPVFATLLDNGKAKFLGIFVASFLLLFYVLGVLFSQPEISISASGTLVKLSGESAFALMSLLGANIMPHNFYLHSSIVQQQDLGPLNVSKGFLCHDHFFAILCTFSGIALVNYVLMNAAANVFYNAGLVLLTFQDALSLMDQAFRSSIVPFAFLLVLVVSRHITAVTGNLGRQAILQDFFGMDIPGWLHHVTIRLIAIIPALYCVWNSGAEGIYQLLIFSQVVVALMLPSSVIPLFRIASSRSVMGVNKVSQFVEFLALIMFVGMLGLKIVFLVEMVFGNSDWVGNLRWNVGSSISMSYIFLLSSASALLCLMLWLATTPLKSATSRLDAQVWNWDINDAVPDSSAQREKGDLSETGYYREEYVRNKEPALAQRKSLGIRPNIFASSSDLNLPKTPLDYDIIPNSTNSADTGSNITCPTPFKSPLEESSTTVGVVGVSTLCDEGSVSESEHPIAREADSFDLAEKTARAEGDLETGIDGQGDIWEPESSSKAVAGISHSLAVDGPGSYRSLSGRGEEGGSGAGSLSRLAGLGRAARRQLATVLEEFWGQLFDFHGQPTQEAKAKKLDLVLGVISKSDQKPAIQLKVDSSANEFTGYFPSVGGAGSDSPINSGVYNSSELLGLQGGIEPSYGDKRGSSSPWSSRLQLLDASVQHSSHNALDPSERRYSSLRLPASSDSERRYSSLRLPPSSDSERRYSSLRLPPSSDGIDYEPATVHGFPIASYLNRIPKERKNDYLDGQMETLTPKSSSLGISSYIDPPGFTSARKLQNGLSTMKPPGFSNTTVSRNISAQPGRPFNDRWSPGPTENVNSAVNTKKFHSLPDISEPSFPYRDSRFSDRSALFDSTAGYGTSSSLHPSSLSKVGAPLAFENLSPSKQYRDPFTFQYSSSSEAGSLWSRQPFEQFGSSDKIHKIMSEGVGIMKNSVTPETAPVVDWEAKLLQSFRHNIIKLLKLEGSDWLFRQNDGADEDLIGRVAAREKFLYEAETREISRLGQMDEAQYSFERKPGSSLKNGEADYSNNLVSSVPNCGDGCVWRPDLIISFGVWCIHRVLELSLMESRPELWGKYTYVLNRLQGVIDLAFSKPHTPMTPCFCLQIPAAHQQRSSPPPISNGGLPPPSKQGKGKITTAANLVETIKDVEIAISCRKGRSGTAAGDVAFPKGKENLASVLKRYKRRLSIKLVGVAT
ncbi:ethylene-insensitive protein 2.2-like isoform X1 [Rhododendron vialii]|uniref:ethylene-insensitive protein 2.2-like isoform X1 n=1 Tax=Rhododendron vialii TaxID=182163 RepID=UPI00265E38A3|nr:ethylene-insensitive protein 2.2-like isoform X1 [Rhododendron vialii]